MDASEGKAPTEEVLAWHLATSRSSSELHNGRPTRALRMRYLLRDRDPDGVTATTFIRHGLDVLNLLQGMKHSDKSAKASVLGVLIVSIENLLGFLLAAEE